MISVSDFFGCAYFLDYEDVMTKHMFNDKVVRDFGIIASRNVSDLETIKPLDLVVRNAMDIVRNYQKQEN